MSRRLALALMTAVLLLVVASRLRDWRGREMDVDEVWSVWQTLGTPAEIIAWTPYDWTPAYYLTLGAWRSLVGMTPNALRWFGLLLMLIGTAAAYQVGRRLGGNPRAGVLTALIYAALGFIVFISGYVRGRAVVAALFPLVFWWMLRCFDRPTLARGALLGASIAALFYFHLSSAVAFAWMGVHTLIAYPRRILRWWLPGVVAGLLAAPEIIAKASVVTGRAVNAGYAVYPLPEALARFYTNFFGAAAPIWFALAALALSVHLLRRASSTAVVSASLCALLAPAAMYVTAPILGFFTTHYAWWIAFGIALWLALGLARLPRPALALAGVGAAVLMFVPVAVNEYAIPSPPIGASFRWLRDRFMPGDVVVIDPRCRCPDPEVWDYHAALYFPQGLPVEAERGQRRLWYLATDGEQDAQVQAQVMQRRLAGAFVGSWDFLLRLYQAPPDPDGIPLSNAMRFHGVDILTRDSPDDLRYESGIIARREGELLRLHLWWSADAPLDRDYSVGVYVLDAAGGVVAQSDSAPLLDGTPSQTALWTPGQLYRETRTLTLPNPLPTGRYRVALTVYDWRDGTRAAAPNAPDGLLIARELAIRAW